MLMSHCSLIVNKVLYVYNCIPVKAVKPSCIIYKEWLLLSLENRKRKSVIVLDFIKNEINLPLQIYEKCECIDSIHIDRMKELVLHL